MVFKCIFEIPLYFTASDVKGKHSVIICVTFYYLSYYQNPLEAVATVVMEGQLHIQRARMKTLLFCIFSNLIQDFFLLQIRLLRTA